MPARADLRPPLLAAAIAAVVVDQALKAIVVTALPVVAAPHAVPEVGATLIPGLLTIEAGANSGLALGAASGAALVAAGLAVLVGVVVLADLALAGDVLPDRLNAGLGLVFGGAVANLIDRIRLGYVLDYIGLNVPVIDGFIFNLADVALAIGLVAIVAAGPVPWLRYWRAVRAAQRIRGRDAVP